MSVNVNCFNCDKIVKVYPGRFKNREKIFCSRACESEFKIKNRPENFNNETCVVCKTKYHLKKSYSDKLPGASCCSGECRAIYQSYIYSGENNPNFGNKGIKNPLYNKDDKMHKNGYNWVRIIGHPFSDIDGWVREHRYVAENSLNLIDEQLVEINGIMYLSPKFDVHHIDLNKTNNSPENLKILTRSEHKSLHHKIKRETKNKP